MKSEVYAYLAYGIFLVMLLGYTVFLCKKRKSILGTYSETKTNT